MLGAPLQCSLFLVRGKDRLHEANCAGAKYLFQQDKLYDAAWDTGDKSVQCSRKVISYKFLSKYEIFQYLKAILTQSGSVSFLVNNAKKKGFKRLLKIFCDIV